jgi:hypothetical protein
MADGSWGANMTQGSRAVGGRLVVDDRRISFAPHGLDRSTGGKPFDRPLTELVSIDVAPRTFNPFDGGLRKRLRLRLIDGADALFVVARPGEVGERIGRNAEAAGGSPHIDL